MRILITGANGYLGRGVVKQFLDDGNEVIATDICCDNIDNRAIKISSDIFQLANPYEYFNNPDVLLHMAWRDGFIHSAESHIRDLPKHYKFLKLFMDSPITKIAVMGSMHEIGFFEGSIKSDTPANPQSLYGISKNALRQSVELLGKEKGKNILWIRGFYIVGNTEYGNSIFSKIVQAEHRNRTSFPFTKGTNQWDFIDYNDFCLQVTKIVEQNKYYGVINACSGYPEKLADRVERFIKDNHFKIKLAYGSFPDRPYDSKAVWGDAAIVNKILKLENKD